MPTLADVIYAVKFGRENNLLTAIRGGGHNGPGLGSCDDGLVIDLSLMKGIRVDPTSGTAWAQGGCTQGDLDHAAHAFGLAVPAGVVSTTGIGGLTLGGGHGYLARRYGLTIDNLLEADVVLADGNFLTASAKENDDLFWALRGGGGNFGVVTSFKYKAHPIRYCFCRSCILGFKRCPADNEMVSTNLLPNAPVDLYISLDSRQFHRLPRSRKDIMGQGEYVFL